MSRQIRSRSAKYHPHTMAASVLCLEARQMLSGNVTVAFDGTNLVVAGDKVGNSVEVLYDGLDVVVRGLDGTTINGSGADFLAVAASDTLPGGLLVNLQKGNDLLYINGGVVVTDDVAVQSGLGNDATVIKNATINGNLFIGSPFGLTDDPGNDSVSVTDTTASTVSISTGSGHDLAILGNVVASEDVIVLLGAGDDLLAGSFEGIENVIIGTGAGNDLFIGEFTAGGFSLDMEGGNDVLFLNDVDQTDPLRQATINMGLGNDKATVGLGSATFASFLSISGSKGIDRFFLAPGATTSGGLLFQEVESTAVYIALADPAVSKTFAPTLKRAGVFDEFLTTLP